MSQDWSCGRGLDILGHAAVVTASDREGQEALEAVFQDFPTRPPTLEALHYSLSHDADRWTVEARGARAYEGDALGVALTALEWHVFTDMLDRTERFHLHGAALCAPKDAASLLILGASGVGKTTLTLALMALGFVPFTDDVIVVEPDALAPLTFPRAFHVDASARRLVEQLPDRPSARFDGLPSGYCVPAQWARVVAPVRAIFFPTLAAGESPGATRLSIADAAVTLLPFSTTLVNAPAHALTLASRLTGQARCYALRMGELAATARLVQALMRGEEQGGSGPPVVDSVIG